MKALVCGGRKYSNKTKVDEVLGGLGVTYLVQGEAKGADHLAKAWAIKNSIPQKGYKANWMRFGNSAGPIRNKEMYDREMPDVVVAFPGGKGTADMVQYAKSKGCKIIEVEDEQPTQDP